MNCLVKLVDNVAGLDVGFGFHGCSPFLLNLVVSLPSPWLLHRVV